MHSDLAGEAMANTARGLAESRLIPIEVVFAKETLDAGDSGYGALLSAWGDAYWAITRRVAAAPAAMAA